MREQYVTLLRHGAVQTQLSPDGKTIKSGPDARLSDVGIGEMRANTRTLAYAGVMFDKIITSPWPRAEDAANVYKRLLVPDGAVVVDKRQEDVYLPAELEGSTSLEVRGYRRRHPHLDGDVGERTQAFLHDLLGGLRADRVGSIAVMSHGTPLSYLRYELERRRNKIPEQENFPSIDELDGLPDIWIPRGGGVRLVFDGANLVRSQVLFPETAKQNRNTFRQLNPVNLGLTG